MLINFDVLQPRSWLPYCMQGNSGAGPLFREKTTAGVRWEWVSLLCVAVCSEARIRNLSEEPFFSQDTPMDRSRGIPVHQAFLIWPRGTETPRCGAALQRTRGGSCPGPQRQLYLLAKVVLQPPGPLASTPTRIKARQRHLKQLLKQRWKGSASLYLHKRHCVISLCTIFQHYPLHRARQRGAVWQHKQMWWWVPCLLSRRLGWKPSRSSHTGKSHQQWWPPVTLSSQQDLNQSLPPRHQSPSTHIETRLEAHPKPC